MHSLLSCVSLLTFGSALLVMRARGAASRLETCATGYERPRGLAEARARRRTGARRAGDQGGLHLAVGRNLVERVVKPPLLHFGRRLHLLLGQGVYFEV